MKFTLSWLKDHLKTKATVDEIATRLSAIGLEVESVDDPAEKLGAFNVARIVKAGKHPNADKLQVIQVEVEKGAPLLEVVCGAPNARVGLVGVFAPLGTYIPGSKITLEKKPVRGVVSNGMMCSAAELELSAEAAGIIELPADMASHVGERYVEAMGLADPVFEVKLTPNRPDCTGVRGIARDLAAAGLGTLKPEKAISGVEGADPCPIEIKLEFSKDTSDACPVFAARCIKGVTNGPSPAWLQTRLKAVGLRPINALVDVTNYISQDRGRPLHVYDADKLKGAVRARLGKSGETFLGLDGKEHSVDDQHVRHRRRHPPAGSWRCHRRRSLGLDGSDGQRADRKRLLRSGTHGANGPQDRPRDRRALPLRARRRSPIRASRPRSGNADDPQDLRGQTVQSDSRR